MATKLTQEEIIKRLVENRGTENFDYSKVVYKNRRTPIIITCKKHGKDFSVLPDIFCSGKKEGCELCGRESYRLKRGSSIDKVIEEFRNVHGDYYDYSKANYINTDTKIEIICPKHGSFFQTPYEHKKGSGCPICRKGSKTADEFRKQLEEQFPQHDWRDANYKNNYTPVIGYCKLHGKFEQYPYKLIHGFSCKECNLKLSQEHKKISFEEFKKRAFEIHQKVYEYLDYSGMSFDVKIKCPKHGWFVQKAYVHCRGDFCPKCKRSRGENLIESYLIENNIKHICQYSFDDCRFKRKLRFDFYLPDANTVIEFNGEQHYKWVKYFDRTYHSFLEGKHCDWLKRKYCRDNNINLIVVPYWSIKCLEKE